LLDSAHCCLASTGPVVATTRAQHPFERAFLSPGVEAVALLLKKLAVFLQRTAEWGVKLAAGVAVQSFGYWA